VAIAGIRVGTGGKQCPPEVVQFLVGLVRLNDNSSNRYSDDHYRAALINALGASLTKVDNLTLPSTELGWRPDRLSTEARLVLIEVTHALNADTMRPSFQRVVGVACLGVLLKLQQLGHLPPDEEVFARFAYVPGLYSPMRRAAFSGVVSLLHKGKHPSHLQSLLRLLHYVRGNGSEAADLALRHSIADYLAGKPPFYHASPGTGGRGGGMDVDGGIGPTEWGTSSSPMNVREVAEQLWAMLTGGMASRGSTVGVDERMRMCLVEMHASMYGREVAPSTVP